MTSPFLHLHASPTAPPVNSNCLCSRLSVGCSTPPSPTTAESKVDSPEKDTLTWGKSFTFRGSARLETWLSSTEICYICCEASFPSHGALVFHLFHCYTHALVKQHGTVQEWSLAMWQLVSKRQKVGTARASPVTARVSPEACSTGQGGPGPTSWWPGHTAQRRGDGTYCCCHLGKVCSAIAHHSFPLNGEKAWFQG